MIPGLPPQRGNRGLITRFVLAFAASLLSLGGASACDIALALAIDVSGSISSEEYLLQTEGLALALRDPTVADALVGANAAVTVIHWTGSSRQNIAVPWRRLTTHDAVQAMAEETARIPRRWRHFSTAIGDALLFTFNQFSAVPDCTRRVIDVSGDGRSNEGLAPKPVAAALAARGLTINGLAIEGSEENLTAYYLREVIAGPGAFVFTAFGFEDYPRKIRRKLITEVTTPVTALEPRPQP